MQIHGGVFRACSFRRRRWTSQICLPQVESGAPDSQPKSRHAPNKLQLSPPNWSMCQSLASQAQMLLSLPAAAVRRRALESARFVRPDDYTPSSRQRYDPGHNFLLRSFTTPQEGTKPLVDYRARGYLRPSLTRPFAAETLHKIRACPATKTDSESHILHMYIPKRHDMSDTSHIFPTASSHKYRGEV